MEHTIEDQTVYLVQISPTGSGPKSYDRQTVVGTPEAGIAYCQRRYSHELPTDIDEWDGGMSKTYQYVDEQGEWPYRFEMHAYSVDIDVDHWDGGPTDEDSHTHRRR